MLLQTPTVPESSGLVAQRKHDEQKRPTIRYDHSMIFSLLVFLMGPAYGEMARMTVEGMVCISCQEKITRGLNELAFMTESSASSASQIACASQRLGHTDHNVGVRPFNASVGAGPRPLRPWGALDGPFPDVTICLLGVSLWVYEEP